MDRRAFLREAPRLAGLSALALGGIAAAPLVLSAAGSDARSRLASCRSSIRRLDPTNRIHFEMRTLDGPIFRIAEYRGRPLMINFFASWCPPCREETPAIVDLATRLAPLHDAVVLGIDIDDSDAQARAFRREFAIPYAIGMDAGGAFFDSLGGCALPTTLFVDRAGRVARARTGALTPQRMTAEFARVIERAPVAS